MAESNDLRRLLYLLILKSALDLVFVGYLAITFYINAFPPFVHGSIDDVNSLGVSGWAVSQARPELRVKVQLYIDGRCAQEGIADLPRPDVQSSGESIDGNAGFHFPLPALSPGEHEARVYTMNETVRGSRTLLIVGKPARFAVPGEE